MAEGRRGGMPRATRRQQTTAIGGMGDGGKGLEEDGWGRKEEEDG